MEEEVYGTELFVQEPEVRLIGAKCVECGNVMFPPLKICYQCHSKKVEKILLSKKGCLHSFSIVRVPPHPAFKTPYVIAWVEMPEDVLVFCQLEVDEKDYEKLRIGMEVETTRGVVGYDENKKIISYKFKPIFR
ncbi:MAG: OB-fold domain-containing protein [Nitrososphaeria archaeon]